MDIIIKINTDNAAFEDNCGPEVARILADIGNTLCYVEPIDWRGGPLKDINGNKVGEITIT